MATAKPGGYSLFDFDTGMQNYNPSIHPAYDLYESFFDGPYNQTNSDSQQQPTAISILRNGAAVGREWGGRGQGTLKESYDPIDSNAQQLITVVVNATSSRSSAFRGRGRGRGGRGRGSRSQQQSGRSSG